VVLEGGACLETPFLFGISAAFEPGSVDWIFGYWGSEKGKEEAGKFNDKSSIAKYLRPASNE
jgi:hypothetical protein